MEPPAFDATASLDDVLAWPELPAILRAALTRVPRGPMTIGDSLRAWTEPPLREWIVGLLALDAGLECADGRPDNMIGLWSHGELAIRAIATCHLWGVDPGCAAAAAYRAPAPHAPPTACAAAFVRVDATGALESAFVFVAGAGDPPIEQVTMRSLHEQPFDAAQVARAAIDDTRALTADGRAVVADVLHACRRQLGR